MCKYVDTTTYMNMNKITVNLQTLESTSGLSSATGWNNCDVCHKDMGLTHFTIVMNDITLVNWVCSKRCSNMFIFQNI